MIYKVCCVLFVFVLIVGCEKAPEEGAKTPMKPKQKIEALQAKKWKTARSPQARFQIDLPQDWTIRDRQEENPAVFTPEDKEIPEIAITGGLDATVANYFLTGNFDINLMSTKYTAEQFLQKFYFPLFRKGDPNLKVESIKPISDTQANATVTGTYKNIFVRVKIDCQMQYLADPTVATLIGQQGWYSFAFITTVAAPPAELDKIEKIAVHVFRSFKPNQNWLREVRDAVLNGMNTRLQMIGRTISKINQMEVEQRMAEMKSSFDGGKGYIHALGGTAEVADPGSSSTYIVDDKYKYYYMEGGTVYGTDDHTELSGTGRTPLEKR